MKYNEISGDILNSTADIICHQVNCQGVMGAGLAKAIKGKYPIVYQAYKDFVTSNAVYEGERIANSKAFLGLCQLVKIPGEEKYVANIFAQDFYGREEGKVYTDYTAFRCALTNLKRIILYAYGDCEIKKVAFPFGIGCGLAGGSWKVISSIIKSVFNDTNLEIEIIKNEKFNTSRNSNIS